MPAQEISERIPAKRIVCDKCRRPQHACICHWIAPIAHSVEVVILQHAMEVHQAKGTARLLHLSLPKSRLITGEIFPESALHSVLYTPMEMATQEIPANQSAQDPKYVVLLYPDTPNYLSRSMVPPPALDIALLRAPSRLRLIVLDATWRKSRKMLYLNPLLQKLPRFSLQNPPVSRYVIRKAHNISQLSTLEATCHALMQLENNPALCEPLLNSLDGFINQQLHYREKTEAR